MLAATMRSSPGPAEVVPGVFAAGSIVRAARCGYIDFGMSQPSPYRVKLDDGAVRDLQEKRLFPPGHDGFIHAPVDVDECIRLAEALPRD